MRTIDVAWLGYVAAWIWTFRNGLSWTAVPLRWEYTEYSPLGAVGPSTCHRNLLNIAVLAVGSVDPPLMCGLHGVCSMASMAPITLGQGATGLTICDEDIPVLLVAMSRAGIFYRPRFSAKVEAV